MACRIRAHAHKVLHPCGTAKLSSARTCTTDATRFLSCTNLFHLDAYMEGGGEVFDQLTEVHTLVGDVVEDGFVTVALVLHVTDLHVQTEVFGNLPTLYHRAVLPLLGLAVFFHIHRLGQSIHTLDVVGRFQVRLFDLQLNQSAGQCHHTDVMTRISLHGHHVTLFQVEVVHVMVVPFAGVLELHLHQVGTLLISRHVGQPVVGVQLTVLASACLFA